MFGAFCRARDCSDVNAGLKLTHSPLCTRPCSVWMTEREGDYAAGLRRLHKIAALPQLHHSV